MSTSEMMPMTLEQMTEYINFIEDVKSHQYSLLLRNACREEWEEQWRKSHSD